MTTIEETKQQVYIRVGHHYVKTIGCHGVLGGRSFECPVDTAFNSKGLIYVAGRAETTPRVTILDIDENFHGEFGTPGAGGDGQLRWPGGIAIDGDDRVYITEQHTQKVNVYDESGGLIDALGQVRQRARGVQGADRHRVRRGRQHVSRRRGQPPHTEVHEGRQAHRHVGRLWQRRG